MHFLAAQLGVDEKTLRNWKHEATEAKKKMGRPRYSSTERFRGMLAVRRAVRCCGWTTGWRPLDEVLSIPTRLIQESLSALKKRHRARIREHREKNRVSLRVVARDVIWTEDAAHLGKCEGEPVLAEVVKDRGSLATQAVAVGPATSGKDVVRILEEQKVVHGLPLVWATDNGPAYKSREVARFCAKEKVIHLFSRPHLPQDNGAAERGIFELKTEGELGTGVSLKSDLEASVRLLKAWVVLDNRPRACRGYQSAVELQKSMPDGPKMVSRDAFYEVACRNMEKAVQGGGTEREKRRAVRMAVYETLEKLNLVSIVRGGKTCRA
jgi:transposase InsO family protein